MEGNTIDPERWAGAHYRVERESSGVVMRKRQRRKATVQAIQLGDPVPDEPHDVVRIFDRSGSVVFEQDWGTNRSGALEQEARIIDDLLRLNVLMFRVRYGIADPAETPAATPRSRARKARTSSPKRSSTPRKSAARKPAAKGRAAGRPKRPSG